MPINAHADAPRPTPPYTHTSQEGLPRFQRIAPDAVVPGIRALQAQFSEQFQQLEGAWKEQVRACGRA